MEGEIKLFDDEAYPAVGKGSGLVNVLVVDFDKGHDYGERMAVARIHAKGCRRGLRQAISLVCPDSAQHSSP